MTAHFKLESVHVVFFLFSSQYDMSNIHGIKACNIVELLF